MRQAANTALGARVHIDATLNDKNMYLRVAALHKDLFIGKGVAQDLADLFVEIHGSQFIIGVGPPGNNFKGIEFAKLFQRLNGRGTIFSRFSVCMKRKRDAGDPGNFGDERECTLGLAGDRERHKNVTGDAGNGGNGKGGQSRLDVIHKDAFETRSIVAFKPDLMIMNETYTAGHKSYSSAAL